MNLTKEQLHFFRTFGFIKIKQFFTEEELHRYTEEFDYGLSLWPDSRHTSKKRNHYAVLAYETTPYIASLLDDERLVSLSEQLLGKPTLGVSVNGSIWHGDTDWHPDVDTLGFNGIRIAIYLEPLRENSGALRFVPGSHQEPLFSQLSKKSKETFDCEPHDLPSYVCNSDPGDIIIFHLSCWHAAFGGGVRRQGALVYFEDPQTPEVERIAIERFERVMNRVKNYGQPSWFTPYWQNVDLPKHQHWVKRIREMGVLD